MLTDDVAAAVLDSLPSLIAVLGPDGTVIRLNEAWRRSAATGVTLLPVRPGVSWLAACDSAAEAATRSAARPTGGAASRTVSSSIDPAAAVRTLATLSRQLIDQRRKWARVEIPQPTSDGPRWLDVRLRTLIRGTGLIVVVDDVTERRRREESTRILALTDPTTGLANRTALRTIITDRLAVASPTTGAAPSATATTPDVNVSRPARRAADTEEDTPVTGILFLDLDSFSHVNSSFGYVTGDATLRAAADRFSNVLAAGDILGRWDGDEFVVVTTETTAERIAVLAERLVSALDEPLEVHGGLCRTLI